MAAYWRHTNNGFADSDTTGGRSTRIRKKTARYEAYCAELNAIPESKRHEQGPKQAKRKTSKARVDAKFPSQPPHSTERVAKYDKTPSLDVNCAVLSTADPTLPTTANALNVETVCDSSLATVSAGSTIPTETVVTETVYDTEDDTETETRTADKGASDQAGASDPVEEVNPNASSEAMSTTQDTENTPLDNTVPVPTYMSASTLPITEATQQTVPFVESRATKKRISELMADVQLILLDTKEVSFSVSVTKAQVLQAAEEVKRTRNTPGVTSAIERMETAILLYRKACNAANPSTVIPDVVKMSYALFGLQPGASKQDVKSAWMTMVRANHPDRGGACADKIEQAMIAKDCIFWFRKWD